MLAEHLIEHVAARLRMDPMLVRERNFITHDGEPFTYSPLAVLPTCPTVKLPLPTHPQSLLVRLSSSTWPCGCTWTPCLCGSATSSPMMVSPSKLFSAHLPHLRDRLISFCFRGSFILDIRCWLNTLLSTWLPGFAWAQCWSGSKSSSPTTEKLETLLCQVPGCAGHGNVLCLVHRQW